MRITNTRPIVRPHAPTPSDSNAPRIDYGALRRIDPKRQAAAVDGRGDLLKAQPPAETFSLPQAVVPVGRPVFGTQLLNDLIEALSDERWAKLPGCTNARQALQDMKECLDYVNERRCAEPPRPPRQRPKTKRSVR
jgi:hypothetical protein